MGGKAVFRIAPVSVSGLSGAKKHQRREFAEPHIDASRSHLNVELVGSGNVEADVLNFVASKGVKPRGKTIAAEMILTAAGAWFDDEKVDVMAWAKANIDAAKEKWGDCVVSASLHMDELAPHIHLFVVPVSTHEIATGRGGKGQKTVTRLSYSREFSDDKKTLEAARLTGDTDLTKCGRLQTWYAAEMQKRGFDLERGRRNSRARHKTMREFQAAMSDLEKPAPPMPKLASIPLPETAKKLGMDTGLYTADALRAYADAAMKKAWDHAVLVDRTIKSRAAGAALLRDENTALKLEIRDAQKRLDETKKAVESAKENIKNLFGKASEMEGSKKELDALMRGLPPEEMLKGLGYEFSASSAAWITEAGAVRIDQGRIEIEGRRERQPRNAVDLLMAIRGIDFAGAVGVLKDEIGVDAARKAALGAVESAKAPSPLPPRDASRWGAAKRYLEGRGIPGDMVDELHKRGKVYADEKAACVFVLGDGEGCEMRGTVPMKGGGAFKGTRGTKGLFVLPATGKPRAVVYVESALDAMSYRALYGDGFTVVGTGGQNKNRLIEHAKKSHAEGVQVIAAFDADDKGSAYFLDLFEAGVSPIQHRPVSKDWNDELRRCMVAGVPVAGQEPARHPLNVEREHPAITMLKKGGFGDLESGLRR